MKMSNPGANYDQARIAVTGGTSGGISKEMNDLVKAERNARMRVGDGMTMSLVTDPNGVFHQRVALAAKIASMDTDLATARANYAAGKGDWHSVHDLVLAQLEYVRQRDPLPSST